jgi:hypothetical protein
MTNDDLPSPDPIAIIPAPPALAPRRRRRRGRPRLPKEVAVALIYGAATVLAAVLAALIQRGI